MEFINVDQMPTPLLLGAALIIISRAIKAIPQIPDWVIPWTCLVLGSIGLPLLMGKWDAGNVVGGLIIGGSVVGLYATAKQTLVNRVEDADGEVHPVVKSLFGDAPPPPPTP